MVLLDSYFNHLQARTGAQHFVIVRDDALRIPSKDSQSDLTTSPLNTMLVPPPVVVDSPEVRVSPSRLQRRSVKRPPPKFEAQNQDYQPPCPPTRVDSVDDLALKGRTDQCANRSFYSTQSTLGTVTRKISPDLRNRFTSLFGTEMHSSLVVETKKQVPVGGQPEHCFNKDDRRVEIKALANLAAPKFPIRRGSRDDLSTLPSSRRRRLHHDLLADPTPSGDYYQTKNSNINTMNQANEKMDLARFLDEVTSVLDNGHDDCNVPVNDRLPAALVRRARSNSEHLG